MPFRVVRNDITKMTTDAIVNTAGSTVGYGSGCDTAVHRAAGEEKLLQYRRDHIGEVPEGEVFLTPGFDLPAKYIIHAVSPLFIDGQHGEEEKLRSCYRKSLELARREGLSSIAFPLIATGSFGYPRAEGFSIAVDEIRTFLKDHDISVWLVVFGEADTGLGKRIYPQLESYIDNHYVQEKRREEYGFEDDYSIEGLPDDRTYESFMMPITGAAPKNAPMTAARPAEKPAAKPAAKQAAEPASRLFSIWRQPKAEPMQVFEEEEDYKSKIDERMQHLSDSFSEYLFYLIGQKGLKNADVWKNGIVDRKTFSKIKNNPDYHPQKMTALCLCIGARLNLDESKDLLARAGYAFSPCDKTDIIFSFFIENGIHDIMEIDIQLEEHGLPCLIS